MNGNNGLIKYEKLHIINTYSKDKYYFKSSNYDKIVNLLNTAKFIPLKGDILVNVSSIESIKPATDDINQVETKLLGLEEFTADNIRNEVITRKGTNTTKKLTDVVLNNIIDKYL